MEPTCAIITMVKHEHDFINQWIEYHLKIGFSHFYILIDNLLESQPEYKIEEIFKKHVTFINCCPDMLVKHWGNSLPEVHHSRFMHNLLNLELIERKIIIQDWVTAIGIDQFIYLNGTPVPFFLKNIQKSCTQIIIPWSICAFNNENNNYDNLIENLDLYTCQYNHVGGHSNGFIRTSNLERLLDNSHSFVSKTNEQLVFIVDEYFTMPNVLNTEIFFDIVHTKLQIKPLNELPISSFHIMLRNVEEVFIKEYAYWGKSNMEVIISDIKANTKGNYGGRFDLLYHDYLTSDILKSAIKQIVYPKLNIMNNNSHYEFILSELLQKKNCLLIDFNRWVKEVLLKPIEIPNNFDYDFYLETYPDLRHFKKMGSYLHYINHGKGEGRICNREMIVATEVVDNFDYDYYLETYPDLKLLNETEARNHYMTYGIQEGRRCFCKMINTETKITIVIHLYHTNQFEKMSSYIEKVKKIFLIVNTIFTINEHSDFDTHILNKFPKAIIIKVENKGTDNFPFLLSIRHLRTHNIDTDFILKLHTKESSNPTEGCVDWKDDLITPIVDYNNLTVLQHYFKKMDNIGYVASQKCVLPKNYDSDFPSNIKGINQFIEKIPTFRKELD